MALLRVDSVGSAGFLPDVESWQMEKNSWSDLRDVSLGENSIRPPYLTELYNVAGPEADLSKYLGIFSHKSFGAWWLVLCTRERVYVTRGGELYDVTPAGAQFNSNEEQRWIATSFNGFLILNNAVDEPHYWAITETDVLLPELTPLSQYPGSSPWPSGQSCAWIESFNSALFAGSIINNAGKFPYLVQFSDFAEPGTLPQAWEPRPENSAGSRDLADGQDEIISGKAFKDALIVRKEFSVYYFRFIGGQFVYQRKTISEKVSCLNKFCVENTDAFQIVVGESDIYVTEGTVHRSIVKNRIKNWFFDNLNTSRRDAVFVLHSTLKDEIWIMAPQGDSEYCNIALIWNYLENTFTTRTCNGFVAATEGEGITPEPWVPWSGLLTDWTDWQDLWGLDRTELDKRRLIFSQFIALEDSEVRNILIGQPLEPVSEVDELYIERMHIPFPRGDVMDWESIKQISYIAPKCRKAGVNFYMDIWLGTQEDIDSHIKWHGPKRWRPGKKGVFFDKSGRFVSIKARMPSDVNFRLTGYDIEYKLVSKR